MLAGIHTACQNYLPLLPTFPSHLLLLPTPIIAGIEVELGRREIV
jgi:hypothetical protein